MSKHITHENSMKQIALKIQKWAFKDDLEQKVVVAASKVEK